MEATKCIYPTGLPEQAREEFRRFGAPLRARQRADVAAEAARLAAGAQENTCDRSHDTAAAVLLVADAYGVCGGGRCGGDGTTRLAPFQHLGSGRRLATDGAAWCAAELHAAACMADGGLVLTATIGQGEGWPTLWVRGSGPHLTDIGSVPMPRECRARLCRAIGRWLECGDAAKPEALGMFIPGQSRGEIAGACAAQAYLDQTCHDAIVALRGLRLAAQIYRDSARDPEMAQQRRMERTIARRVALVALLAVPTAWHWTCAGESRQEQP